MTWEAQRNIREDILHCFCKSNCYVTWQRTWTQKGKRCWNRQSRFLPSPRLHRTFQKESKLPKGDLSSVHSLRHVQLFATPWTVASVYGIIQGIFLTHGSNLGLLHCRQILYHLSHRGNPNNHPKRCGIFFACKKMEMQEVSRNYETFGLNLPQVCPDMETWV